MKREMYDVREIIAVMQVTMVVEKEELRIFQGVSDCFPIFFITFIFNISIFLNIANTYNTDTALMMTHNMKIISSNIILTL